MADRVHSPSCNENEIIPIASMSKAFFGLVTVLFLYDKNNSDLLNGEKPENITIGQLLKNRKENIEKITEEKQGIVLKKKLENVNKRLEYANENPVFANTIIKLLLNHALKISKKLLDLSEIGKGSIKEGFTAEPEELMKVLKVKKIAVLKKIIQQIIDIIMRAIH